MTIFISRSTIRGHRRPYRRTVVKQTVGAGYFAVLKEPVLAGREFEESDQRVDAEEAIASGAPVPTLPLVLNEKAAHASIW